MSDWPADPVDVRNWHRRDPRVTTSGQPSEDQLAAIAALGVRHVVNLGLHSHEQALADEGASVRALGMGYVHIPVDFAAPREADFARFCAVMAQLADETIHVHCIANWRVSAFFYRYDRDVLRRDATTARATMEAIWRPDKVWAAFTGD